MATKYFDWKIYRLGRTERWYDRHARCWMIRALDEQGNQIGGCHDCYTARESIDIQKAMARSLDFGPRK